MLGILKSRTIEKEINFMVALLKGDDTALLIDARTPEEYAMGHIPGSINIPLGHEDGMTKDLDKDTPLLVYCHSGVRSRQACSIYEKAGFTNVTNIGGIINWDGEIEAG